MRRVLLGGGALLLVLSLGGWYWKQGRPSTESDVADTGLTLAPHSPQSTTPDTINLPAVVNPRDSAVAAQWGVELVATNDRADANLRLTNAVSPLPAGTMSPVLLGNDSATWYKVVACAWIDRSLAELCRSALRQVGTLRANEGVVARVPFALRLETGLSPDSAKALANRYVRRGVAAYPLSVDGRRASVYAGAFASPEQAVLLLAELRAAGMHPAIAYRVGRTY